MNDTVVAVVLEYDNEDYYIVKWKMASGTVCNETFIGNDLEDAILKAAKIAGVHYSMVKVEGEDKNVPRF